MMDKKKVLSMLIDAIDDNNNFILQLGRWNSNETAMRSGILSNERYAIAKAQISNAVNFYIDELPDQVLQQLESLIEDTPPGVSPPPSPQQEDKTVLFFAANPSQQAELKLKDEFAVISQKLQDTDAYELKSFFTGSTSEFIDAINQYKPSIIHFSGHGEKGKAKTKQDELAERLNVKFEDGAGLIFHDRDKRGYQVLGTDAAKALFRRLKRSNPQINIVLLNACYSRPQAIAISENDIYTIGTKISIGDEVAIEFSDGFYKKYAETGDVVDAVNYGITKATAIDFASEENIFLLYKGEEVDLY